MCTGEALKGGSQSEETAPPPPQQARSPGHWEMSWVQSLLWADRKARGFGEFLCFSSALWAHAGLASSQLLCSPGTIVAGGVHLSHLGLPGEPYSFSMLLCSRAHGRLGGEIAQGPPLPRGGPPQSSCLSRATLAEGGQGVWRADCKRTFCSLVAVER